MDGKPRRAPEPTDAGAQLEALVTRLPVVLFELDREGRYTLSMGSALANLGRQPGQVVGYSIFELYPNLPQVHDAVRSALLGSEASRTVETHGRVFEAVYLPKRGAAGGAVEGVIGIAYDVTDLHLKTRALEASERRLRESEARFRSLVTNMRDIIFCHGTQGDRRHG
jgi:PAS domain-containing protein